MSKYKQRRKIKNEIKRLNKFLKDKPFTNDNYRVYDAEWSLLYNLLDEKKHLYKTKDFCKHCSKPLRLIKWSFYKEQYLCYKHYKEIKKSK